MRSSKEDQVEELLDMEVSCCICSKRLTIWELFQTIKWLLKHRAHKCESCYKELEDE